MMKMYWPDSERKVVVLVMIVILLTCIIPSGAYCDVTVQPRLPGPSLAPKTYYVNDSGLDTNDGSQGTPFREIRKALTFVIAGDTVIVANGTYLGFDIASLHGNTNAYITITAPQHNATITVTTDRSDNRDTIYITDSSFVIINGLRSFNANRAAMRISVSNNITVSNVTFGNNAVWGIFTDFSDDTIIENSELYGSGSQHGIYFSNSPDRPVARNNTIHDNYGCGIHNNGDISMGGDGLVQSALIENNIIYNNGVGGGSGINMDGAQNSTVRNNILYNNHASGIAVYDGDAASGPFNDIFYHNTIDVPVDGRYALQIQGSVGPVFIRNNILYNRNPIHGGLTYGDANDIANTDSDYNIMDRMSPDDWATLLTLAQWQAQGHEAHSFSALPSELFIDVNNRDYHLSSNSTAIDKGQNLTSVKFDKDDDPRPSGNASDIGAYEFQQIIVPDSTPPGAILDLSAFNATYSTVDLVWNATGDDAKVGTAAYYDMRYSKSTITGPNWGQATAANNLPAPLPAGTKQSFKVTNLDHNTKYYFAIRATDAEGNTAAVSNVANATTLELIPDLYIGQSDIVFSNSSPTEGENITITVTVHSVNITNKLTVFVECRVDGAKIPEGNVSTDLNATTTTVKYNWTTFRGNQNVTVFLDSSFAVIETNETNNFVIKPIQVKVIPPPPLPDLWINSEDIVYWPSLALTRGEMTISGWFHVENLTSAFNATVQLMIDSMIYGNQTVSFNKTEGYASFFVVNQTKGYHNLSFFLDVYNEISESNETNNFATNKLYVFPPDVFLTRDDIRYTADYRYEGDILDISASADGTNTLEIVIMVEMLVDGKSLGTKPFGYGTEQDVTFKWTAVAGTHVITVRLDATNLLDEDNETNNVATSQIWVQTLADKYPLDLWISAAQIGIQPEMPYEKKVVFVSVVIHAKNHMGHTNATIRMYMDYTTVNETTITISSNSTSMTFSWIPVKGLHNITFEVEADKSLSEENTKNNIATKAVAVRAKPKKPQNTNYVYIPYILAALVALIAVVLVAFLMLRRKRKGPNPSVPRVVPPKI